LAEVQIRVHVHSTQPLGPWRMAVVAGPMSGTLVPQPQKSLHRLVAMPKAREDARYSVTPRDLIHGSTRIPTPVRGPLKKIQSCSSYRSNATPRLTPRCTRSTCEQMDTKPTPRRSPIQMPRQEAQHARTSRAVSLALLTVESMHGISSASTIVGGLGADLAAARAAYKERINAVERSQNFTHVMLEKIEALHGDVVGCSTTCSASSPSPTSTLSCDSSSPRDSP